MEVYSIRERTMLKSRLAGRVLGAAAAVLLALVLLAPAPSSGQGRGRQPDFIPPGYDDYQNLLDQLGIKKVRSGRNPRVKDTSDEATANRYKDSMPDLMTFKDGKKVKTADQWPKRRAEIVEDFEREVYGRVPRNVPAVKWEVTNTAEGESGGIATVSRTLVGHVDNSAFPKIKVDIQASLPCPGTPRARCRSSCSSGAASAAGEAPTRGPNRRSISAGATARSTPTAFSRTTTGYAKASSA
jgi:hypothetical protein